MSEAPTAPDPAPDNRLSRTLKRYKGKLRRRPSKPRCKVSKRHVKFELFYSPSESSQMLMAEECEQRYPALKARDHCRATNGDAIALANVCLQRCLAHHTQYATLSHRWSEETSQISLLQHNLHERLSTGIALSALPIMFRDVVHILRQVGFKYVWIDCLCMIQDSDNDEDWRYEATRIGAVYQNSTLTVLMAQ
ncbi:HET-domain-containing protein [Cryphonectria parasitica EP155]|uniref:HET-domain-containing protein n=1 Tax=Cryphonectria parasitica (strain ATCC 38755 / EP155) TaxID=660469 RepID=A0A9P4XZ63_CRYP1|nr:HET-domain-containing protein [Cryphonectria parasitica EP155]KAF3764019.1 HET-domain-containing protein [Cryphonectria parasitica EP155]